MAALGLEYVGGASATSFIPRAPSVLIDRASVAIEGTVVSVDFEVVTHDDGERQARTHYHLQVSDSLLGGVTSGELRLALPGGPIGDLWVDVSGVPRIEVGDTLLVLGTRKPDDTVRLTGWTQMIFIQRDGAAGPIAVDSEDNAVGGLDCGKAAWVVLPLSDAPSAIYDGPAMSPEEAVSLPGGPVFVDGDPADWAMGWDDLVASYRACVEASANAGVVLAGRADQEVLP